MKYFVLISDSTILPKPSEMEEPIEEALPEQEEIAETCVCCGKKAKTLVYWGKAY